MHPSYDIVRSFCPRKQLNCYKHGPLYLANTAVFNMTRKLQLELLEHHPIRDAISGLNEPSGLALDRQETSLYTVSDDTKIIFNLDPRRELSLIRHFISTSKI